MKLNQQLALIRDAAHSIEAVQDPSEIIGLVSQGKPFDLLFFSQLTEPRWLPLLISRGFFSKLPSSEKGDDGAETHPHANELRGLRSLAANAPDEVLRIIESLAIPENPVIKDQIMGILAEIKSPSMIERVLVVATKLVGVRPYSNMIWIDGILGYALIHGHGESLLRLVEALLEATLAAIKENPRSVDAWQIAEIDRNILTPVSESIPLTVARVVFSTFVKWTQIQRVIELSQANDSFESHFDFSPPQEEDTPSSYWLEDFHGSVIGFHEFEAIFAHRLFEIGSMIYRNEKSDEITEFDNLLRSNSWKLFARLRWQLYADFPQCSFETARMDAIARIPNLGHYVGSHGYEMAQMLEVHSTTYGDAFLTSREVESFCAAVRAGPIDHEGNLVIESTYPEDFHRTQLYPIRSLLKGSDLEFFNSLFECTPEIRLEAFKPFSSGGAKFIESVPPKKALAMSAMSDAELWDFLNNWIPDPKCPDPEKWWIQEDVNALGGIFVELLESTPERFPAYTEWWKNLTRPSVLFKPLERATVRISEAATSGSESKAAPTENDWRNWFGLASWITNQRTASHANEEADDSSIELEDRTWEWPCMVVVKFLTSALESNVELPSDFVAEIGPNLRKLIETSDSRLKNEDKPSMGDWQTTAINSVRGTAVEGLLHLALFHKRHVGNPDPDDWIFDFIVGRLILANESPAVFAICGSRLRLLFHLFADQFKSKLVLLLPAERVNHRNALLLSHVIYDNPISEILDVIPIFPRVALEFLSDINSMNDADSETGGDYGGRLGVHLSFYYWNQSFCDQANADSIMDRYFITARPSQRAKVIREIVNIFEKKSDDPKMGELYDLVRRLWERRFAQIVSQIDSHKIERSEVETELSAFINWLDCECFPIEWRSLYVLKAIKLLSKSPHLGNTIKTLERFSSDPTRLHLAMEILDALLSKEFKEAIWSIREDRIRKILQEAFSSDSPSTVKLAEGVQEILLRSGLFEYLDLTSNQEPILN